MSKKLIVFAIVITTKTFLIADTETVGGYTWTYRINGNTAEIYKGSWSAAISPSPTGIVAIPSSLGGKTVTSIGDYALCRCSGMVDVTMPESVTNIGVNAFRQCIGLTGVTIGGGVTSIGSWAFADCSKLLSVTIGKHVKSIAARAFGHCNSLMSIYVAVGNESYVSVNGLLLSRDGKSLVSVPGGIMQMTVPDGVAHIVEYAAYYAGLTSVTIPNSVKNIEPYAFNSCASLMDITIGNGVTNIGAWAFSECRNLTNLTIVGNHLTNIDGCAFARNMGLVSATIENGIIKRNSFYDSANLKSLVIGNGTKCSIESSAFFRVNTNLVNVTMGGGITSVGNWSFRDCEQLTSVIIKGNGTTSIGDAAFDGCSGLKNLTIDNGSIGTWAFQYCNSLECVTLGNGVTSIGSLAFGDCTRLRSVMIPGNVTSIGDHAFMDCSGLTNATIESGVTSIGDGVFSYCSQLNSVTIPNTVTNIGQSAFYNCRVGNVTIPSSVVSIGNRAFINCNLKNVFFMGNAPTIDGENGVFFSSYSTFCSVWVKKNATGFTPDSNGRWQGMTLKYIPSPVEMVEDKGVVIESAEGYIIAANDGEVFSENDFKFGQLVNGKIVDTSKGYEIELSAGGKKAKVKLKKPTPQPQQLRPIPVEGVGIVSYENPNAGVETLGSIAVESVPGLYYQPAWGSDLNNLTYGEKVQATGDMISLGVVNQTGSSGFYKVSVSDN